MNNQCCPLPHLFLPSTPDVGVYSTGQYSSVKEKMLGKYKGRVRELKTWDEIQPALLDEHCKEIYVIADLNGNGDGANLLKLLESRGLARQSPKVTWVNFAEKDHFNNRRLELSHVNIICHEGGPNDHDIIEQLMMRDDLEPVERSRVQSAHQRYPSAPEPMMNGVGVGGRDAVDFSPINENEELPTVPPRVTVRPPEQPNGTSPPVGATPPPPNHHHLQATETGHLSRLLDVQQELVELAHRKIEQDQKHYEKMENLAERQKGAIQEQTGLLNQALVDTDTGQPQRTQDPEHTAPRDEVTIP